MEPLTFDLTEQLNKTKAKWLVTGAAGFIGSNLCLALLKAGQRVVAVDNMVTGQARNIHDLERAASLLPMGSFEFIEGSVCELDVCMHAIEGVQYVLHQAAIGSVPRSIAKPLITHRSNVDGFVNVLEAATSAKVRRFVYASSSAVYGDSNELPKVELRTGNLLSPYAATKAINETYASVFQRTYGIECIGLRYFNVFGPRQDPLGQYAAVIPKWMQSLLSGSPIVINGDGSTSRDFCYIANVIQANLRAALVPGPFKSSQVFNIAYGGRTTLLELANALRDGLKKASDHLASKDIAVSNASTSVAAQFMSSIEHTEFRAGDILHSHADISSAQRILGYLPTHSLAQGLAETCPWYLHNQDRLI